MNSEYLEFVNNNNIDMNLATKVFNDEKKDCENAYGAMATDFVINRWALFRLMIKTGIKG